MRWTTIGCMCFGLILSILAGTRLPLALERLTRRSSKSEPAPTCKNTSLIWDRESISSTCPAHWQRERKMAILYDDPNLGDMLGSKLDFAAFDSGGRLVSQARGLKGVKGIQKVSTELYMIGKCDQKTWAVITLSERINVEFLAFYSHEPFSSYFGKIAILGSDSHPTRTWKLLAIVEIDPRRQMNYFDLRQSCSTLSPSSCWVTNIKFVVLSYFPSNDINVCTLTRFRVYGSTLMQRLESKMMSTTPASPSPEPSGELDDDNSDNRVIFGDFRRELAANNPNCLTTAAVNLELMQPRRPVPSYISFMDTLRATNRWRGLYKMMRQNPVKSEALHEDAIYAAISNTTEDFLDFCPLVADSTFWEEYNTCPAINNCFEGASCYDDSPLVARTADEDDALRSKESPRPSSAFESLIIVLDEAIKSAQELKSSSRLPVPSGPPLLSLVDRVTELERKIQTVMQQTLSRLLLIKELFAGVSVMGEAVEDLITDVESNSRKLMIHDIAMHRIMETDIGYILLSNVCVKELRRWTLPGSERSKRRRTLCLSAELLRLGDSKYALLTDLGRAIRSWSFKQALISKAYQLRRDVDVQRLKGISSDGEDDGRLESATIYLDFLKANHRNFRIIQKFADLAKRPFDLFLQYKFPIEDFPMNHEKRESSNDEDPLFVYFAMILYETSYAISFSFIIKIALAVIALDTAIRIRDTDDLIDSLLAQKQNNHHAMHSNGHQEDDQNGPELNLTLSSDLLIPSTIDTNCRPQTSPQLSQAIHPPHFYPSMLPRYSSSADNTPCRRRSRFGSNRRGLRGVLANSFDLNKYLTKRKLPVQKEFSEDSRSSSPADSDSSSDQPTAQSEMLPTSFPVWRAPQSQCDQTGLL